jgi:phage-related protein
MEVVTDFRGDTFWSVYTVRFVENVYVLHAFQKKSKSGHETTIGVKISFIYCMNGQKVREIVSRDVNFDLTNPVGYWNI